MITSASPAVHRSWAILCEGLVDTTLTNEKALFEGLEEQVLGWMGNPNLTCEVFHIPFHTVSLARGLFIIPPSSGICSLLEVDVQRAYELWRQRNQATDQQQHAVAASPDARQIFFNLLPPKLQVGVHQLVASLHSILQMADVREDIFTLGSLSRLVGEQLEAWQPARARRKMATEKISLILIDRMLDLAGPTTFKAQTILGKLRTVLPSLPGQPSDCRVDLSPLFGLEPHHTEKEELPPGCLCGSFHLRAKDKEGLGLEDLLGDDVDAFLMDCCKGLTKARKDRENTDISVQGLENMLDSFANDEKALADSIDVLTRSRALVLAHSSQTTKKLDKLADAEDRFVKAWSKSAKEGRGFLVQLSKLVRERRDRGLLLDDLLVLISHCYALMSPEEEFYPEDEDRLQSAISEALVRDKDILGPTISAMAVEEDIDELVAFRIVKRIFQKLNSVRKARGILKGYHSLIKDQRYASLLEQLLLDVFSEDRREIPDLEHRSGGLGGLLKSGIGLFGVNVNRVHPRENPVVWLYVVGGVTPDEVKAVRDLIKSRSAECKIVVGGTKLLSPMEMMNSLFVHDPLMATEL